MNETFQAFVEKVVRAAVTHPKVTTGFVCFVLGMLFERLTTTKRKG